MSPTPRAAGLLAVAAATAVLVPPPLAVVAAVALVAATLYDALSVRGAPRVGRHLPSVLSRGVPARLVLDADDGAPGHVRLRQPALPDLPVEPAEAEERLEALVTARRRGRHLLPAPAARREGRLGLGRWYSRPGAEQEVLVYPDLPAATRLAMAVRRGRFGEVGRLSRGTLGLGTDFESIRDYVPDDDVRQVNWRATARVGRPMTNQYRVEQDRDVICVVDAGRLMSAPLGDLTRLDAAVDAVASVCLVADEVGDRSGAVAFDAEVRRRVTPSRGGADSVIRALFDVEPAPLDSDYELAFRTVGETKRAFVLVFTDLLEEAAARPLVEAVPVLARHHAVAVASATDTDLEALVRRPAERPLDVYAAGVALDVLEARARAARQLRAVGADVLEAPAEQLGATCVKAYLRAKARARL